jgi:hypothetical protein
MAASIFTLVVDTTGDDPYIAHIGPVLHMSASYKSCLELLKLAVGLVFLFEKH